jgi:hypothetical protein
MGVLGGIGVVLTLLSTGNGWAVAADAPTAPPAITVEGRRLSAHLTNVPLEQALELILERSGAEMTILGDAAGEVTIEFDDLPLHDALRRLLAPRSFVLVYVQEGAAPPPGGRLTVVPVGPDRADFSGGARVRRGKPAPPPGLAGEALTDEALLSTVETGGRGGTVAERTSFLEGVVATGTDKSIRSMALKTLTAVSPASLDAIAQAALGDPSAEVRRRALELLVANGRSDELVMNTLLMVARTDPDASVREQSMVYAKHLSPSP